MNSKQQVDSKISSDQQKSAKETLLRLSRCNYYLGDVGAEGLPSPFGGCIPIIAIPMAGTFLWDKQ